MRPETQQQPSEVFHIKIKDTASLEDRKEGLHRLSATPSSNRSFFFLSSKKYCIFYQVFTVLFKI